MAKFSELKYQISTAKAKHEYEMEKLKAQQEKEMNQLKSKCSHKYDDGTNASRDHGTQRDSWYKCDICGTDLGSGYNSSKYNGGSTGSIGFQYDR